MKFLFTVLQITQDGDRLAYTYDMQNGGISLSQREFVSLNSNPHLLVNEQYVGKLND